MFYILNQLMIHDEDDDDDMVGLLNNRLTPRGTAKPPTKKLNGQSVVSSKPTANKPHLQVFSPYIARS
jgi:hypothetical protein